MYRWVLLGEDQWESAVLFEDEMEVSRKRKLDIALKTNALG